MGDRRPHAKASLPPLHPHSLQTAPYIRNKIVYTRRYLCQVPGCCRSSTSRRCSCVHEETNGEGGGGEGVQFFSPMYTRECRHKLHHSKRHTPSRLLASNRNEIAHVQRRWRAKLPTPLPSLLCRRTTIHGFTLFAEGDLFLHMTPRLLQKSVYGLHSGGRKLPCVGLIYEFRKTLFSSHPPPFSRLGVGTAVTCQGCHRSKAAVQYKRSTAPPATTRASPCCFSSSSTHMVQQIVETSRALRNPLIM